MSEIGKRRRLDDGKEKVMGVASYGTDQLRPGTLHARLVQSPYPHAKFGAIDPQPALDLPGVVAVITAADLPEFAPTTRGRLLLPKDRVIFTGQPVALVLGETEAAAQDGSEVLLVDFEPLPAATDMDSALAEGAPAVWPDGLPGDSQEAAAHGATAGGEDADETAKPQNLAGETTFTNGDVDAALATSAAVVESSYETAGVHQGYLEPHALLIEPDIVTGGATVYTSTQAAFFVRQEIASILHVPESDVTVVPTAIGGGFGGKFLLYDPLIALVAKMQARPIKLVLTRLEELVAGTPAPATKISIRVGADKEGKLTALEADFSMDAGCFPSSMTGLAGMLLGSLYRVDNIKITAREILTFRPSIGAYRAPCSPQAAFALESALDELATKLDIDPLELRLKNASRPGDPMVHRAPWPSMGMREVLEAIGRNPIWTGREEARAAGRGVGIAIGGWPGGTEPAASSCSIERDGTLHVHVGSVDLTGTNTSLAMLAAEAFGVDADRVRVISGNTGSVPYAGASGGSKTIYTVGPAVMQAATEARKQTLDLAAEMFEADAADLEIVDGKVQVKGAPDKAIPLGKIAARTMRFGGRHAPVWGHGRHANNVSSPSFCAQVAEVEVDEETGAVTVHKLGIVQDVGRAINPAAVEGQLLGGATQGLGWALYESLVLDEGGQVLTASLMDYALPDITSSPSQLDTELIEVPSDLGPMGARGVGEPPVIPTAAAVANAIADATSARLTRLPMTPPRVLEALQG